MAGCGGLGGVFERYAQVQPERPAVVDPEGEWSYQEGRWDGRKKKRKGGREKGEVWRDV